MRFVSAQTRYWPLWSGMFVTVFCATSLGGDDAVWKVSPPNPSAVPLQNSVFILSESTIADFLKQEPTVLVLFYAPWCHWCRELLPRFSKAAALLASQNIPIKLAQIDAAASDEVGKAYDIRSYPTMRLYMDGQPREYTGGRKQQEIVTWVISHLDTEMALKNANQLDTFMFSHEMEPIILGRFQPQSVDARNAFISASRRMEHAGFAEIMSLDVLTALKSRREITKKIDDMNDFILLINPHAPRHAPLPPLLQKNNRPSNLPVESTGYDDEPQTVIFTGSLTNSEEILQFIKQYTLPLLVNFEQEFTTRVFQDGRPVWVVFTNNGDDILSKKALQETRKLAVEFRKKMVFLHSNGNAIFDRRLRQLLAVDDDQVAPTIRIFQSNPGGHSSYYSTLKFKPEAAVLSSMDTRELKNFLLDFLSNRLTPFVKSESVPDPTEDTGPVYSLVASQFEEKVLRGPYDSVVEFYAPWCGHCRQLEATYRKVAAMLKPNKNIRVYKMDATQNEINMRIIGFPTIAYFRKASSESNVTPVIFYGERSVENIIDWISVQATNPFDAKDVIEWFKHRGNPKTKSSSFSADSVIVEEL